jgi:hypothetical protein
MRARPLKRRKPSSTCFAKTMAFSWPTVYGNPRKGSQRTESHKRAVAVLSACLALTLYGIAAAWLSVLPDISVSQSQSFQATDPFSSPFVVSNNGPLTVDLVKLTCMSGRIQISHQGQTVPPEFHTDTSISERLKPGQQISVPCNVGASLPFGNAFSEHPLLDAMIDIVIEYRPRFVFWKIMRQFRFETFPEPHGKLHWQPSPVPEYTHHDD